MSFAVIFTIIAFVLGYAIVPNATKELLVYKYDEINRRWNESLEGYANHMRFVCRKPTFDGERVEKGLAQWGARQVVLVNGGKLSYEKICALRNAGVIGTQARSRDPTSALSEREVEMSYRLNCTIPMRIACALGLSATALAASLCNVNPVGCTSALVAGMAMEATFLCDMQARIIPWQLTLSFGLASMLFALSVGGLQGLLTSLAVAFAMYLLLAVANSIMQHLNGSPAIGDGDLRFIPMICLFSGLAGTFWGFIGASIVMGLIAVVAVAFKGGTRKSYIPYAPGLSCWFVIGLPTQLSAL